MARSSVQDSLSIQLRPSKCRVVLSADCNGLSSWVTLANRLAPSHI